MGKLDRKVTVKPETSPKSRPRVQREINDNYCVLNVAEVKDPVTSKSKTVILHVDSFVANVHSVTRLPQKKGVNPNYCYNHTEIKHVKGVSCVDRLNFAKIVTNIPAVTVGQGYISFGRNGKLWV